MGSFSKSRISLGHKELCWVGGGLFHLLSHYYLGHREASQGCEKRVREGGFHSVLLLPLPLPAPQQTFDGQCAVAGVQRVNSGQSKSSAVARSRGNMSGTAQLQTLLLHPSLQSQGSGLQSGVMPSPSAILSVVRKLKTEVQTLGNHHTNI